MAIEPLCKISLIGPGEEVFHVMERLQIAGTMHLIPPAGRRLPTPGNLPPRAALIDEALRFLKDVPGGRRPAPPDTRIDLQSIIDRVLDVRDRRRSLLDQREKLRKSIAERAPWGEFEAPAPGLLGDYRLYFYRVPVSVRQRLADIGLAWQEVNRDNRFSYVVIIAGDRPAGLPGLAQEVGLEKLSALEAKLEAVEVALEEVDSDRVALTRWLQVLEQERLQLEDTANLLDTSEVYATSEALFQIQAWIPLAELAALQTFCASSSLVLISEPVRPTDRPPTLLRNTGTAGSGQDLLGFFTTPAYGAWDPSGILLLSFALFFAMIVADAGYALLLGGLTGLLWSRLDASEGLRRFRRLCLLLCGGALAYGMLAGSYWGLPPPADGWLALLAVINLNDYGQMMTLSVLIGVGHIILASLIWSLHTDGPGRWRAIGWSLVAAAGALVWLLEEGNRGAAWLLGCIGLLQVLLFSDDTPVRSLTGGLRRLGRGLLEVRQVTRLFGDVLSYLRLFALGLASSSLALAFNEMAASAYQNIAGVGLLVALFISVLGHGINLVLAVVGGVIHGLRLNFIEFLSWGTDDEGYPFRAFQKRGTS